MEAEIGTCVSLERALNHGMLTGGVRMQVGDAV